MNTSERSRSNQRVRDTYPLNEIDRLKLVADRSQLEVERTPPGYAIWQTGSCCFRNRIPTSPRAARTPSVGFARQGVVVSLDKHVGEWVEPGTPILKIEQIDRLRVEGFE